MKKVHGAIDGHTRCKHYHSDKDIIAIKFKCCEEYYGCYSCHEEVAGHAPLVWPRAEWGTPAILCGACGSELSVERYMTCDSACPNCSSSFNPGCKLHYHLYFDKREPE